MPAFYKILNSTAVKAASGRSFIYVALINNKPFTVGHTTSLNLNIQKNLKVETFVKKYSKPPEIKVIGSVSKEYAATAAKSLSYLLKSVGFKTLERMEDTTVSPDEELVEATINTWKRKYRVRSTPNRIVKRSELTVEDIAVYFKSIQNENTRTRKILIFMLQNYYQNYSCFIIPMPLFYMGNSDLYRKDLNLLKEIVYTKESVNKYSSNNFYLTKAAAEKIKNFVKDMNDE